MGKTLTIKEWANEERPREKMVAYGAGVLSNAELLAIILRSGVGSDNAVELARRILLDCGNDIAILSRLTVSEIISKYRGVGVAKATAIVSAMELARRRFVSSNSVGNSHCTIVSSRDAYCLLRANLCDLDYEEFWVIMLNRANRVICKLCLASGGMDSTIVDVRILLKKCIENKAIGVIVSHNHPSENLTPSINDKMITKKIANALQLVDIKLLDHLIITSNSYYSFSDNGEL